MATLLSSHTPTAELPRLVYPDPPRAQSAVGGLRSRRALPIVFAALAAVLFVGLGAALVHHRRSAAPTAAEAPAVLSVDSDGWRYVFHAPTGSEALYRLADDPACRKNLLRESPERVESMRTEMLRRAGARSLEELQEPHRRTIESLKSLGYL